MEPELTALKHCFQSTIPKPPTLSVVHFEVCGFNGRSGYKVVYLEMNALTGGDSPTVLYLKKMVVLDDSA